jgi:hypothetical protein
MATEIGALIVELRANSAQFQAEMDAARKGLDGVGSASRGSSAHISQFASVIVRELIPGVELSNKHLSTLIRTAFTATGVLGGLAQAGLVAGAGLVGYAAGNALANFRDLIREGHGIAEAFKLAVGSTKAYEEALKKASDEQKEFVDRIAATRSALAAQTKTINELTGKGEVTGSKLAGDESGAAGAQLRATLKGIEDEKKARDAALADQFRAQKINADARAQLEANNANIINLMRKNAYLDYAAAQKKIDEDLAQNQLKLWKEQTELLMGEFAKRVKLRQDFETNLGQGGLGGGTTVTGLGEVAKLNKQVEKETRDLAGARRLGMVTDKEYFDTLAQIQRRAFTEAQELYNTWAAFPAVERAVTQAVERMTSGYGTLGEAMQQADVWAKQFVPTTDELASRQAALIDQFTKIPAATAAAGPSIQKLANDYNELAWQAAGATQQIYSAAAAMVYFHSVGG